MPQRSAAITSLPQAFEVVKEMQAHGLERGEGYRPLGRQAAGRDHRGPDGRGGGPLARQSRWQRPARPAQRQLLPSPAERAREHRDQRAAHLALLPERGPEDQWWPPALRHTLSNCAIAVPMRSAAASVSRSPVWA